MSNKERKALGRGFSALLQSVEAPVKSTSGSFSEINLAEISLNPKQPRLQINPERLEELAQSIKVKGVIQPILVRLNKQGKKRYELIAGERRFRASKLAGFDKIPAILRAVPDKDIREIALIENIQRDDLNPLEESLAYQKLIQEQGYTHDDLSKRLGKSRSAISNQLRLLKLPEDIQKNINNNQLSAGHARALLSTEDAQLQKELHQKIIAEKLSVREAEKLAKALSKKRSKEGKDSDRPDPQMKQNQERLEKHFMTKVRIIPKGRRGKIEIEYLSDDDFNRIFTKLIKAN
jgi:ParB family chromosome partitioning protein